MNFWMDDWRRFVEAMGFDEDTPGLSRELVQQFCQELAAEGLADVTHEFPPSLPGTSAFLSLKMRVYLPVNKTVHEIWSDWLGILTAFAVAGSADGHVRLVAAATGHLVKHIHKGGRKLTATELASLRWFVELSRDPSVVVTPALLEAVSQGAVTVDDVHGLKERGILSLRADGGLYTPF